MSGTCKLTERQYESCWKTFQHFIILHPDMEVWEASMLAFLSFLFYSQGYSQATTACYTSALLDPLLYGYNISLSPRFSRLFRRGLFLQHPTPRPPTPSRSLHRVMEQLPQVQPGQMSVDDLLDMACFLIALASGLRVSITGPYSLPEWTTFADDSS